MNATAIVPDAAAALPSFSFDLLTVGALLVAALFVFSLACVFVDIPWFSSGYEGAAVPEKAGAQPAAPRDPAPLPAAAAGRRERSRSRAGIG